jgi:hypothetical protein
MSARTNICSLVQSAEMISLGNAGIGDCYETLLGEFLISN